MSRKREVMDGFQRDVLPCASDPRENFRATAVLNFWGLIDILEASDDLEDQIIKNEFLAMPIAKHSRAWAVEVLTGA